MYFPYLRGRQFELLALRELVENDCINEKIIPIIEPIKPTATLVKTIESFVKKEREIAIVLNPSVGDFKITFDEMLKEESRVALELNEFLSGNDYIIQSYIMDSHTVKDIKKKSEKCWYLIINTNRDSLDEFLGAYPESENINPRFALIPDDRAFRRKLTDGIKVLFEDNFKKQPRNIDYLENVDEFFSDIHLCFLEENYVGFSDYSIVGEEFSESGFAPVAVAIHIVYFDNKDELRVHHFVSKSNEGIEDPAKKFGEALGELVSWCKDRKIKETLGLKGFYECYESRKYPGLGTVKKLSIMHHIELMSDFLGGEH